MKIETREVLADAYLGGSRRTMLSHAVEVDEAGKEIRVLCDRVKLDSLADHYAQDTTRLPTCGACRRLVQRKVKD